jgi:uncharacterized protein YbjT (DUF2867 family)
MSKTAILLGATGFIGGLLLERLIADASYEKIKLFSRSSAHITSTKVEEHLVDLVNLDEATDLFFGDEVFCCIGTTTAKTKDKKKYRSIDYGIPVAAAKLAKQNNINTFIVLSSMGADVSSAVFYGKTKGEMERDVLAQKIPKTFILRPSLIGGRRKEFRLGEKIGKVFMTALNPFLTGNYIKYKIIHPEVIVNCMTIIANSPINETIISSDKIVTISNSIKE